MKERHIILNGRDIAILQFLWKWKVSTTEALCRKFFPDAKLVVGYNRLSSLRREKLLQYRASIRGDKCVWVLTQKGYQRIKETLPAQVADGFVSESIGHDLICTAVHLGEWLVEAPIGVEFFSEQELRRLHEDVYPQWVPRGNRRRPDGYWYIPVGNKARVIALEVETTQKSNVDYAIIAKRYAETQNITRVLWIALSQSLCQTIHRHIHSAAGQLPMIHNFVSFEQFQKHYWQSKIELGPEQGKTIAYLLNCSSITSPLPVMGMSLLNGHKSPHRSTRSNLLQPSDFSDRLGSSPNSSYSRKEDSLKN